jgi:hypothetical protein
VLYADTNPISRLFLRVPFAPVGIADSSMEYLPPVMMVGCSMDNPMCHEVREEADQVVHVYIVLLPDVKQSELSPVQRLKQVAGVMRNHRVTELHGRHYDSEVLASVSHAVSYLEAFVDPNCGRVIAWGEGNLEVIVFHVATL